MVGMRAHGWLLPATLALLVTGVAHAVTPAQRCQQGKNKEAGKYAYCRQKAEAKFAVTSDGAARTTAFQRCLDKYNLKWPGLEESAAAAGGACLSADDQTAIQSVLDTATTTVATALA